MALPLRCGSRVFANAVGEHVRDLACSPTVDLPHLVQDTEGSRSAKRRLPQAHWKLRATYE
jgi:hypothetical protein